MNGKIIVLALAGTLAGAAEADGFCTDLSKGWRLTVGPQFDFNANARLGVKAGAVPLPAGSRSGTRAAAKAAGDAVDDALADGTRADLGGGAFVDPSDSAGGADGGTWNWRAPGRTVVRRDAYVEETTAYEARGGSAKDDSEAVGAAFGVERAVWRRGRFGVDAGFSFAFALRDGWFKGSAGGWTRTDSRREGTYDTTADLGNADVFGDPWARNPDGSFGAGSFDGPGPVLDLSGVSVSHGWTDGASSSTTTRSGPFSLRGDLQTYEFQLALRPYYELTDWFVVRGTLGAGVDYRRLGVEFDGRGDGTAHGWDCYMVLGLGGMFRWEGVCLGADVLRKEFSDGLDVDTRHVRGTVDSEGWILRAYVGWEF